MSDIAMVQAPTDDEGNLMEWYSISLAEKIGLPNYSNVDIGPVTVGRWIKKGDAEAKKVVQQDCKDSLNEVREITIEALKAFARAGGYGEVRQAV